MDRMTAEAIIIKASTQGCTMKHCVELREHLRSEILAAPPNVLAAMDEVGNWVCTLAPDLIEAIETIPEDLWEKIMTERMAGG